MNFPPQGQLRPPDVEQVNKSHGRIEKRELWLVDSPEVGQYLADEFDWPGLNCCGWIRRSRRASIAATWQSQETTIWICSRPGDQLSPALVADALRGHWTIENGLFRVHDVSYNEDRLHARIIAPVLSQLRNTAINLIRREGFRYIPDAWRNFASRSDRGLSLLLQH